MVAGDSARSAGAGWRAFRGARAAARARNGVRKICGAVCALMCTATFGLGAAPASARPGGIDSSEMMGPISSCNMGACHFFPGTPDPGLTVTISGPSDLLVNESANYTIDVAGTFSPAIVGAGVHVAAFFDDVLTDDTDGILGTTSIDAQITASPTFNATGQFTHLDAQNLSIGTYAYTFSVLAPANAGELRLEGAMQGFNNDNTSLNDEWQFTTKVITVPEPAPLLAGTLGALLLAGLTRRRARC